MKYIVVTGGVCHGIGKGIVASTIAYLLQQVGLNVSLVKFDGLLNRLGKEPYHEQINYLYEGEEVFVLDDGFLADSDFGSYERFLNKCATQKNNILNGDCWYELLTKEFDAGGVKKIRPHLINIYKQKVKQAAGSSDVAVIEVGGTVGDLRKYLFFTGLERFEEGK